MPQTEAQGLTKDQWYAHPDFRKELTELLNHPTFRVALALVNRAGLKPTPVVPNIDLMHFFALMGAKRDGYFEGLQNLLDLTQPQATRPPEQPPWTTKRPGPDADHTSAP